MRKVAVVGLGDMGSGLAKNLLRNGFAVAGFDVSAKRLQVFADMGGTPVDTCQQLGNMDAVFIMVMNGTQVQSVVDDLKSGGLKSGSTIIVTATIHPHEIMATYETLSGTGIDMIDSPVSGGLSGAQNGELTLMVSGADAVMQKNADVMGAISSNIFHVGSEIGMGQTVKASLQAFIGASFTAIFESLVLGTKAGIPGQVLFDVFGASGVSSPLFKNCASLIMDRKFEKTGSHIGTMYKDLGITMEMAKKNGVPMPTTASAFELFQAGKTVYPEGDNWTIVRLLEHMAQSDEVKW